MKADKKYYNKFGSSKSLVHKPEIRMTQEEKEIRSIKNKMNQINNICINENDVYLSRKYKGFGCDPVYHIHYMDWSFKGLYVTGETIEECVEKFNKEFSSKKQSLIAEQERRLLEITLKLERNKKLFDKSHKPENNNEKTVVKKIA